jgi:hypothetical protein
MARLELNRAQILSFRRRVGALEERLPPGARSLRQAAWAGLQDSAPRAALLSIHARVAGAHPEIWDDDAFVQIWGPRWAVYVVPARDRAVFTVGRHPDGARDRRRAEVWAARIARGEPGLGVLMRYAATTGTVLIRWDGARAPKVWTVPRPMIEPLDARRELARRYLRVFGPGTSASFGKWAAVSARAARAAFDGLELVPVRTPLGDEWILARDESLVREQGAPSTAVRLLPSGDPYWLCHDAARRAFLVPDERKRDTLWLPSVWPGALLVAGELAGTWRRQQTSVSLEPWRRLTRAERDAVDAEIASLPLLRRRAASPP